MEMTSDRQKTTREKVRAYIEGIKDEMIQTEEQIVDLEDSFIRFFWPWNLRLVELKGREDELANLLAGFLNGRKLFAVLKTEPIAKETDGFKPECDVAEFDYFKAL